MEKLPNPEEHLIFEWMDNMIDDNLDTERRNIGESYHKFGLNYALAILEDGTAKWDHRVRLYTPAESIFADHATGNLSFSEVSEILNTMVDGTFSGYTRQQR